MDQMQIERKLVQISPNVPKLINNGSFKKLMHNIFESFRNFGLLDQYESFFKFSAIEGLRGNYYCENHVVGLDLPCVIDGNASTAYAENVENNYEHEQKMVIQFLHSPVYINTLYYSTLCAPPKDLLIQGSNDNINWEVIANHNAPLQRNSKNVIKCYKKKHFSYIKLSQTKNVDNFYRMHLVELEIYGTFGDIPKCTIHSPICRNYLLFFISLFKS